MKTRWILGLSFTAVFLCVSAVDIASADDGIPDPTEDVIYRHKAGTALTMDVFEPKENSNGAAIVFVVSGGWYSNRELLAKNVPIEFVKRGYTVFAVVHGSQPRFTIPEILGDIHRAVRYIRYNAKQYGIDPNRIGIYGGSAGGHLSLMQATAGNSGNSEAEDLVERVSSRVQAVACFFPPTDFLNYGKEGEEALGTGILAPRQAAFAFHEFDRKTLSLVPITDSEERRKIGIAISPIYHATKDDPPTLIIHGDADERVPIQQAKIMIAKLNKEGVPTKLIVRKGEGHGWENKNEDREVMADWFDEHLKVSSSGE